MYSYNICRCHFLHKVNGLFNRDFNFKNVDIFRQRTYLISFFIQFYECYAPKHASFMAISPSESVQLPIRFVWLQKPISCLRMASLSWQLYYILQRFQLLRLWRRLLKYKVQEIRILRRQPPEGAGIVIFAAIHTLF